MSGRFVVFEGPDGAGKTTQIARLAEALPDAIVTREPGGTKGGEAVRAALLSQETEWSPLAEALLMNAARDAHIREVIEPALAEGRPVLCDRFSASTAAYQGGGGGLDRGIVETLRGWVCPRAPDLTLVFDLDVKVGLDRAAARGRADRFEAKGAEYHERVRAAFRRIAAQPGAALIDASGSQDDVAARVAAAVHEALPGLLRA